MCGIAGIYYKTRKSDTNTINNDVLKMVKKINHRGPDCYGIYTNSNFGMGMCRLSIIDTKEHEIPYSNEDGTLHIAYNGEIYNHKNIKRNLNKYHDIKYGSDPETLLHAFEEKGLSILNLTVMYFPYIVLKSYHPF